MRTSTGKGNSSQKILSYYRVNFNFSPPYQVLCDGPIIFQSFKNDIFLKHALPTLFGAPTYPVVTDCIVNELRQLGESFSNSAIFAKRATRIACAHQSEVSAAECIRLRAEQPFESKLAIATNDAQTILQVSKIPGIPIVTIFNQTKLILKKPSTATLAFAQQKQAARADHLLDADKALLNKVLEEKLEQRRQRKPSFKPKRAKGPNPLSVKKTRVVQQHGSDISKSTSQSFQAPSSEKCTVIPNKSIAASKPDVSSDDTPHIAETSTPPLTVTSKKRRRRRRPNAIPSSTDQQQAEENADADQSTETGAPQEPDGRARKRRRRKKPRDEQPHSADKNGSVLTLDPNVSKSIKSVPVEDSQILPPKQHMDKPEVTVSKENRQQAHAGQPSESRETETNSQLLGNGQDHVKQTMNKQDSSVHTVKKSGSPYSTPIQHDSETKEHHVPELKPAAHVRGSSSPTVLRTKSVANSIPCTLSNSEATNKMTVVESTKGPQDQAIMEKDVKISSSTAEVIGSKAGVRNSLTEIELDQSGEEDAAHQPRKKKQRKNRRRRPKKTTDIDSTVSTAVEAM